MMLMLATVVGIATTSAQEAKQQCRGDKAQRMQQLQTALQLSDAQMKDLKAVFKQNDEDRQAVRQRCDERLRKVLSEEQMKQLREFQMKNHGHHKGHKFDKKVQMHQQPMQQPVQQPMQKPQMHKQHKARPMPKAE